jgi:SAM-dependent methyltransferase
MSNFDPFLNLPCSSSTLDIYGPRHSILRALQAHRSLFKGTFLDVGCGRMPYRSLIMTPPSQVEKYIGLDLGREAYGQPDIVWDGMTIPLSDGAVDCAMATEVFEHCPAPEAVMKEIFRVMKPGAVLFFTVPFLWPLHDAPYDEGRYTPFAIDRLLGGAGFITIQTAPLGGWDASLAQMIGLWIRRRPMPSKLRSLLSIIATPIVKGLFSLERHPLQWNDSMMFTGIGGTAIKAQ